MNVITLNQRRQTPKRLLKCRDCKWSKPSWWFWVLMWLLPPIAIICLLMPSHWDSPARAVWDFAKCGHPNGGKPNTVENKPHLGISKTGCLEPSWCSMERENDDYYSMRPACGPDARWFEPRRIALWLGRVHWENDAP